MPDNEQAPVVDNNNVTAEGGWDAFGNNQATDNQNNTQDTWATDTTATTTTTTTALSSQPTFGMYSKNYHFSFTQLLSW